MKETRLHNVRGIIEHAMMALKWNRRNDAGFAKENPAILSWDKPIGH